MASGGEGEEGAREGEGRGLRGGRTASGEGLGFFPGDGYLFEYR